MSKKSKSLFVDCSEAATCCTKAQYDEAGFFEKIKLTIHLAFCRTCRTFSSRNSKLTRKLKEANLECCSEEKKKEWRENISKLQSEKHTS